MSSLTKRGGGGGKRGGGGGKRGGGGGKRGGGGGTRGGKRSNTRATRGSRTAGLGHVLEAALNEQDNEAIEKSNSYVLACVGDVNDHFDHRIFS